jgi:Zn-dependent M16 (insulinase) family peptidase
VKEPFLELLKMSMATFINAMTYPDKTVYPVASTVRQDFLNLADVYFDAVFHPNITPMTLKQEGHHLAFERAGDPDSPLVIKGIVYNEMRGAYSDVDSLIDRESMRGLFPDSPYGRDSGGDPDSIPSLTYSDFVGFYRRLYHPSNAFVFAYGDLPSEELLAFLDRRLADCPPAGDVDTVLARQPRWSEPVEARFPFPIARGESGERRGAVTLNWLVGDTLDVMGDLAMSMVDVLLLGSSAAPLRRALVDSQLGDDLTSSGYNSGILEPTFHVGLKGIDLERAGDVCDLVDNVLRKVATEGIARDKVEIAFQQMAYSHREIQSMYPLRLMGWVYSAWIYDLKPETYLRTGELLDELREQYEREPGIFARLVEERLVRNPHRLTAVFEPRPGLQEERDRELSERMAARRAELGPEQLRRVAEEEAELVRLQETPNTPEQVASLPQLRLADIPSEPRVIPRTVSATPGGVTFIHNDVFANGVNYLALAVDLRGLSEELWPYVPLFAALCTRQGTADMSYTELAEAIAGKTGGIYASCSVTTDALDPRVVVPCLNLSMKALDETYESGLDLVGAVLGSLRLDDVSRLRDVIVQQKTRRQSDIVPSGHSFAARHAGRGVSVVGAIRHLWAGVPQVQLGERLARGFDQLRDDLSAKLEAIRAFVLDAGRLRVSFTGTAAMTAPTIAWLDSLPRLDSPIPDAVPVVPVADSGMSGLVFEADVAYCAACLPAPHASAVEYPALRVFSQLLSFGYLWEEIRVKGGAYGGSSQYDAGAGVLNLISYRDPSIVRTLDVYRRVTDHVRNADWGRDDIERAVIGCAKGDEKPVRPESATMDALWQELTGLSDDVRRERRQRLLELTPECVRDAALALLAQGLERCPMSVLSSRQRLDAANAELGGALVCEDVVPPATVRPGSVV